MAESSNNIHTESTSSRYKWSSYTKKLEKWKYFEPILGEISEKDDIQVDLLIGANCGKALEPIKFISSEVQGPYAY